MSGSEYFFKHSLFLYILQNIGLRYNRQILPIGCCLCSEGPCTFWTHKKPKLRLENSNRLLPEYGERPAEWLRGIKKKDIIIGRKMQEGKMQWKTIRGSAQIAEERWNSSLLVWSIANAEWAGNGISVILNEQKICFLHWKEGDLEKSGNRCQ